MNRIPSFEIDHEKLERGLYVSRYDYFEKNAITTFDIRVKKPYADKPMSSAVAHTVEHLCATWLRNASCAGNIVYFGPMGCLTGFYLIIKGQLTPWDVEDLFVDMFEWVAKFEGPIPGATIQQCGNYLLNDLDGAKLLASEYLNSVLYSLSEDNTIYPH